MTVWLSRKLVLAIHDEQLAQHGGAEGVRDMGLLERALSRPLNLTGDGDPSPAELGAMYAIGIARNHPFVDGNKRTAFATLVTFLDFNGIAFEPPDAEAVIAMLELASGQRSDEAFTRLVDQHTEAHD